jgi:hypothetical protein
MVAPMMWDAAFDYVRMTYAQGDGYEEAQRLYRIAARGTLARAQGGEVHERPWQAYGYRGHSFGLVQMGEGAQGLILQASQWAADDIRALGLPYNNVSRADIAITVWYDGDPGAMVKGFAQKSEGARGFAGAAGWRITHIEGYGNGDTTYLGARTSDIYVRIYDKGRESAEREEYRHALRYEVEYKGSAAAAVWEGAHRAAPGRHWLAAQVLQVLRRRGVFVALPAEVPVPAVDLRTAPPSDTDKRLAWLRNQVAPSIDKLVAAGVSLDEVRQALGLA